MVSVVELTVMACGLKACFIFNLFFWTSWSLPTLEHYVAEMIRKMTFLE